MIFYLYTRQLVQKRGVECSFLDLILGFRLLGLGFLFLDVLGELGFVVFSSGLGVFSAVDLELLVGSLSADAVLGDEALDLGGFVVGLGSISFTTNNFTADDILENVVLLVQGEHLDDVVSSLGSTDVVVVLVSEAFDFLLSSLDNLHLDHSEVGSIDAATDGLSLAFTNSAGLVGGTASLEKNSRSSIYQDALFHLESLLVVSSSKSEHVAFPVFSQKFSFDLLSHASVEEGANILSID